MELRFPEHDLCLIEEPDGVRVRQHGREYIARKWHLTPQVFDIVRQGVSHELSCLWQEGHPSSAESRHISFSYTHEAASWVFCIGDGAGAPKIGKVTISQRHQRLLTDPELCAVQEAGGGKNFDPTT